MDNEEMTLKQIAEKASANNGGVTGRGLDRAAKKAGLTLSYTTVDKILAGTYTSRPSPKTLDALAVLANLSKETVYRAARVPLPQASLADQLPPDANTLTAEQRRVVIELTRVFIKNNRELFETRQEVVGNEDSTAPITQAEESSAALPENYDLAAYNTGKESAYERITRQQDEDSERFHPGNEDPS